MNGIGTLVNLLAVLVGGGFGVMIKGRLQVRYQQVISQTVGVLVMGIGLYEGIRTYFMIADKRVEIEGMLLIAFSLLFGGLIGMAIRMDSLLSRWGASFRTSGDKAEKAEQARRKKLQADVNKAAAKKGSVMPKVPLLDRTAVYQMTSARSGNLSADGFVAATLILCANSMLLSGVYADCMGGDSKPLIIKAVIDLVLCFALAFVYGAGVLYAAIPLGVLEGGLTLLLLGVNSAPGDQLATFITGLLTPTFLDQMTVIGAVILVGTGACLAFDKKFKIANLFPALFIPAVYETVMTVVGKFAEK